MTKLQKMFNHVKTKISQYFSKMRIIYYFWQIYRWKGYRNLHIYENWGQVTNKQSQSVASSCKLELDRFSTLLRIQDIAECVKGKEIQWGDTTQKNVHWGGTAQKKRTLEGGGHRKNPTIHLGGGDMTHTFLMEEQLGWGHRITLKKNTQNCFASNSVTKYRSEAVLWSKRTAGYPLSHHRSLQ